MVFDEAITFEGIIAVDATQYIFRRYIERRDKSKLRENYKVSIM